MIHTTLQPAARTCFDALDADVSRLRQIFRGPAVPVAMMPEIMRLTTKIQQEAGRVRRFAK